MLGLLLGLVLIIAGVYGMLIKCGWCGKDLGTKEPTKDTSTSHGICEECIKRIEKEGESNQSN